MRTATSSHATAPRRACAAYSRAATCRITCTARPSPPPAADAWRRWTPSTTSIGSPNTSWRYKSHNWWVGELVKWRIDSPIHQFTNSPTHEVSLLDPPSTQHEISVVKHHSLPGRHGQLGCVEHDLGASVAERPNRRGGRLMPMANLRARANGARRLRRNPVHLGRRQRRPLERGLGSNDDRAIGWAQVQHVHRRAGARA